MSSLIWLADKDPFPPVKMAFNEPNGLLAAGGDLSPDRLEDAYRQGIFPWFSDGDPILWWSPDPRCVIFPERLHISKSLRKKLNQCLFKVTIDQDFGQVIAHCAKCRKDTWITKEMSNAYNIMHLRGIAHSFEVWHKKKLVGGLYGLGIGRLFFGESMFSLMTDASKIAFVYLCNQLYHWGYPMIDCQLENSHLTSLGAETIPRNEFLAIINDNIENEPPDSNWNLEWEWSKP